MFLKVLQINSIEWKNVSGRMWGGLDVISRRFNFIISYHNLCGDSRNKKNE